MQPVANVTSLNDGLINQRKILVCCSLKLIAIRKFITTSIGDKTNELTVFNSSREKTRSLD